MKITAISNKIKGLCCLLILAAMLISLTGCNMGAPGLTTKEVHRRHMDVVNVSKLQWQDDIDAWLLLDRPSRLSKHTVR